MAGGACCCAWRALGRGPRNGRYELRGKTGWFASAASKVERDAVVRWGLVRAVEQVSDAAKREAKVKPGYSPVGAFTARQFPAVAEAWVREVAGRPAV